MCSTTHVRQKPAASATYSEGIQHNHSTLPPLASTATSGNEETPLKCANDPAVFGERILHRWTKYANTVEGMGASSSDNLDFLACVIGDSNQ